MAEYLELGEIEPGYSELIEGRVVITPGPLADHNNAALETAVQLKPFLPPDLEVILDIDVDLELVPPQQPGSSRRPDPIVVQKSARQRQRREGGMIRASEVVVVMEVVSPGSQRTDHVAERADYADAGIPHYWILDPEDPVSLLACHLAGEFGYADGGAVHGTHRTDRPFPLVLDLDALL